MLYDPVGPIQVYSHVGYFHAPDLHICCKQISIFFHAFFQYTFILLVFLLMVAIS